MYFLFIILTLNLLVNLYT